MGENLDNDDGAFDPSMLCSVEITAVNRESSSSPELKRPKPIPQRGPMKLSNSMFKKKARRSPIKMKKRPKPKIDTSDIEEITLTDDEVDENSTSYVTQSDIVSSPAKKNLSRTNDEDSEAVDSDVSLE